MSFDNNNRGAVWKNRKKEKETQPDYTGSATIDGVEYWVSAWRNDTSENKKRPVLSFFFEKKENKADQVKQDFDDHQPAPAGQQSPPIANDDWDDDIPF